MSHQHRGQPPEIHTTETTITFVIPIVGSREEPRLVLRCERDGEIYVAIRPAGGSTRKADR